MIFADAEPNPGPLTSYLNTAHFVMILPIRPLVTQLWLLYNPQITEFSTRTFQQAVQWRGGVDKA